MDIYLDYTKLAVNLALVVVAKSNKQLGETAVSGHNMRCIRIPTHISEFLSDSGLKPRKWLKEMETNGSLKGRTQAGRWNEMHLIDTMLTKTYR